MTTKLKVLFFRSGLHQYELAFRLGCTETRVSRMARGRIEPTDEECQLLAGILGVTPKEVASSVREPA